MLNHLNNHFNETKTANGAFAYVSTQSSVLDMFAMGGAMRNRSDFDIVTMFSKAYGENPVLALKTLFYLRDIRFGQGERRFFKLCLKHLALHHKDSLAKNLHLISEFGRWDDMWVLLETELKDNVISLIKNQLELDKDSEHPSLLGKWLASENTSSYQTKKYAKIIREGLGLTPREYRKLLSALRKQINIVETKLSEKKYDSIEYDKLPSKAGMVYRSAFFRNDEERYKAFLDSLSKGEVKVNSDTLYPNDIVGKIIDDLGIYSYSWNRKNTLKPQDIKLFEGQWRNLKDFIGENSEDSLVMADVSGSMYGQPLNVSIALAMYIAERNKGAFKDHFMTFSESPQLVKIQGKNIVEKVNNLSRANWDMSTNIEKALETILDVAVKNNLPPEEIVKKVYIISDTQFNKCVRGASVNIFENLKSQYREHGYEFPSIVFWNVNAHNNSPATMNEVGVQLVSGYSPSILTQLLGAVGVSPYEFMLDVINSERYKEITA